MPFRSPKGEGGSPPPRCKGIRHIRVVGRFSWHEQPGDFAERWFLRNYFRGINLSFRKIRKDKNGKKPDGFVLDQKRKVALAEIKLIKRREREPGVQKITTDDTVKSAIDKAKKQLGAINSELPKIIYIIGDDTFLKPESLRSGIFGKRKILSDGMEKSPLKATLVFIPTTKRTTNFSIN